MSKTLLIRRNKANLFRIGKHVFFPGVTEFKNQDDIREIQAHPSYQSLLDNKVHEVVESKSQAAPEKTTSDITEMNARDAIKVVSDTYAIPVLIDMHQSETDNKSRKSVIDSIADQIADIKAPPEKKDEDEDR